MEALKRCAISVFCLLLSFLASIGMSWSWMTLREFTTLTLLGERVAFAWLWVGAISGYIAMVIFFIVAIVVLFISAEKTLKIFE